MREIFDTVPQLGTINVEGIFIDPTSRDETTQILRGLQLLYSNENMRSKIGQLLNDNIQRTEKGRKGMSLWNIFVLGVLRLNLGIDYDRLKNLVDNHIGIRQMLGFSNFYDNNKVIGLQTIIDNAHLLSEDLLTKINHEVIQVGHEIVGLGEGPLKCRCDSAVTKTNAHYPTDINILWDAIRKSIILTSNLCASLDIKGWRQYNHHLKIVHNLFYACCQRSCKADKNGEFNEKTVDVYDTYISKVEDLVEKINNCLLELKTYNLNAKKLWMLSSIESFVNDAEYQISLIVRRIFGGEKIPNCDKIHSLFERHTEWICKGKAGVRQELGLRVAILEDQYGFILHHRVMQNETDDKVAVKIIDDAQLLYPNILSCSFDKGFWSPKNRNDLEERLDVVAMKKKGYSSKINYEYEHSKEFLEAKEGHSAVESGFNALQNHGLARCPDKGSHRFKRYVAIAITARNIQKLGSILIAKEIESKSRSEKIKEGLEKRSAA